MPMNCSLIITGATNNPGRVLIECITAHREEVRRLFPGGIAGIFRASSDTSHFEANLPGARKILCDLTDTAGLTQAFEGADTVFHAAGIHWSREVAEAAARLKVRRLIAVHTCGIYSKYKAAGEEYRNIEKKVEEICRKHGIRLTILRPTMIYGCRYDRNLIRLIGYVDRFPLMPVVSRGRYVLQPVHYRDLGKAFFDVLMQEEKTASGEYILSGDRPISLREMLRTIGIYLGKRVRFISCPYLIAYPGAWLLYLLSGKKYDLREKVQRLCEPRAYGHEAAAEAFGFRPRSFEAGIADEVQEYLDNKAHAETELYGRHRLA